MLSGWGAIDKNYQAIFPLLHQIGSGFPVIPIVYPHYSFTHGSVSPVALIGTFLTFQALYPHQSFLLILFFKFHFTFQPQFSLSPFLLPHCLPPSPPHLHSSHRVRPPNGDQQSLSEVTHTQKDTHSMCSLISGY